MLVQGNQFSWAAGREGHPVSKAQPIKIDFLVDENDVLDNDQQTGYNIQ